MVSIGYVFARILKKMRGKAIVGSSVPRSSKVEAGSTLVDTTFGRHTFCGYDCTFIRCEVGSFCSIASNVVVGGARHPMEYVSTSPVFLAHKESISHKYYRHEYTFEPQTIIGNDVWIGEGVYIKGGVSIGHGAVIGMGSVVTKDIPPYGVYAGNPARLIRFRFDESTIDALLSIQWWNFPDDELRKYAQYFNSPDEFIRQYQIK